MLFLIQHVHVETRGENILDLILSTEPNMIDAIRVKDPFSDHNIVTYDVIHVMKFQKCQNSRFIRKSGVSENRAFIRKSKGLGKSGFYA